MPKENHYFEGFGRLNLGRKQGDYVVGLQGLQFDLILFGLWDRGL